MFDQDELAEIDKEKEAWEKTTLQKTLDRFGERRAEFVTTSSVPVERLYTPADITDFDYERDLGFPGQYPFTRGVHPTMYRGRLCPGWLVITLAQLGQGALHQMLGRTDVFLLTVCRSKDITPKSAAFCGTSGARDQDSGSKSCSSGALSQTQSIRSDRLPDMRKNQPAYRFM